MRIVSWRYLVIAGAFSLSIIYAVWWGKMMTNRAEYSSADFIAFYAAGQVAKEQGFSQVYNIEHQQGIQEKVVGFPLAEGQVLLYNHLPYLVPILTLVVNEVYTESFMRWDLILIVLYAIGAFFFLRSMEVVDQKAQFLLYIISIFTFFPLYVSLWQGQDTAFLFLGVALWCIGVIKKGSSGIPSTLSRQSLGNLKREDWLIGLGLALATVRPHICIALALPALIRYPRSWWRFALPSSILALISVILLNMEGTVEFINLLLISSEGSWFGMNPDAMLNLLGFLLRIFHFQHPEIEAIIGWSIYFVGLIAIWALWKGPKWNDSHLISLTILIAIMTAPHLHLHDLTLLILPILFVVKDRSAGHPESPWLMLPIGISVSLLLGLLFSQAYFITPYLVFLLLGWLIVSGTRNPATARIPDP